MTPSKKELKVFTGSPDALWIVSTLVCGERDAILIDAQFTLSDARKLVAMIHESGKVLRTVYITHHHPDHYFGVRGQRHHRAGHTKTVERNGPGAGGGDVPHIHERPG